ncbi:MAG: DUF484 family protein [Pseudomonadota bacterium]
MTTTDQSSPTPPPGKTAAADRRAAGAAPMSEGTIALDAEERDLIRSLILAEPGLVLDDDGVMRALIQATGPLDRNIVDLRDRLVERLETRLSRLMRANRSMMAAAYENVASTEAVHAAVLELIAAPDLPALAGALARSLPDRVAIQAARLVVEADVAEIAPADTLGPDGHALVVVPRGTIADYLGHAPKQAAGAPDGQAGALGSRAAGSRGAASHMAGGSAADAPGDGAVIPAEAPRRIVLRATNRAAILIYDQEAVASEALMPLHLEDGAALLALGSCEAERFSPDQGTDLLDFLAAVTERLAGRLLADWQPPQDT